MHPVAPVHVLEVEEEALVHRADVRHRLAPRHQAAADAPVHVPGGLVIEVAHQVIPDHASVGEQPAEEGPPQQEDRHRIERAATVLERAVGIVQARGHEPGLGGGIEVAGQRLDAPGPHLDVGIEHQVVASAGQPDPLVDGPREAEVLAVGAVLDPARGGGPEHAPAPVLRDTLGGRIQRSVVQDDHFVAEPRRRGFDRRQAAHRHAAFFTQMF